MRHDSLNLFIVSVTKDKKCACGYLISDMSGRMIIQEIASVPYKKQTSALVCAARAFIHPKLKQHGIYLHTNSNFVIKAVKRKLQPSNDIQARMYEAIKKETYDIDFQGCRHQTGGKTISNLQIQCFAKIAEQQ